MTDFQVLINPLSNTEIELLAGIYNLLLFLVLFIGAMIFYFAIFTFAKWVLPRFYEKSKK